MSLCYLHTKNKVIFAGIKTTETMFIKLCRHIILPILVLFCFQYQTRAEHTLTKTDSVLRSYFLKCKAEINSPAFLQINDTLARLSKQKKDRHMEAVAALEIHELGKEYIAVVPTEPNDEFEDGEVLLLIYSEDADGNPVFESLDDPEEFEIASAAFEELIAEMAQEEDDDDDDEEDDGNIGYLDDISDIIPGVSIDLDN